MRALIRGVIGIGLLCVGASFTRETAAQAPPAVKPPPCPVRQYTSPNPDKLEKIWASRKKYRLVIGAGTYPKDKGANRSFVAPTARLVDKALEQAGYTNSLGLLIDGDATYSRVESALAGLAPLPADALVVIYYVGHGSVTSAGDDIALAVTDQQVGPGYGIRVRDLLAKAVAPFDPLLRKMPRAILVLETCFSGGAAPLKYGFEHVIQSQTTDLKRLAFMSATGAGEEALELGNLKVGAFGHYFAGALTGEYACADITPDGALTVGELSSHIYGRLTDARSANRIAGTMRPEHIDRQNYSTVAYDGKRVADNAGYRERIREVYEVDVTPQQPDLQVDVTRDGKVVSVCPGAGRDCSFITDELRGMEVVLKLPGFEPQRVRLSPPDSEKGLEMFMRSEKALGRSSNNLATIRIR